MSLLTGPLMRRLRPGVAATLGAAPEYRRYWEESNERARQSSGPLWVALGDSTAQGLGASAPDCGYVGQLLVRLREAQRRPWRVVNLSVTGARISDVVREQVARLSEASEPELVTCAVGANDVIRPGFGRVPGALHSLIRALPSGAVLATVPQGLLPRRVYELNQIIRAAAPAAGLRIADAWAHTGAPWQGKYAPDGFHPNDAGYADWCAAFADVLGLDRS
ncbi:MAG: GDSL-type esterase/lipase family protein, partial [Actinomycetota bacterium]|nr:GDSL-type esterase/lipase family protein [Actinomycetota bacterium]